MIQHSRPDDISCNIVGYRVFVSSAMGLAGTSKDVAFVRTPTNQLALHRVCELNPEICARKYLRYVQELGRDALEPSANLPANSLIGECP
jgi:hypothetical protein